VRAGLRLKRLFLRTLVTSLALCAIVAVVTLLIGEFNDTTGKVLVTLVALAVHSGIAMACVAARERQRWPVLSAVALVLFGANLLLLLGCVWLPLRLDEETLRAVATTGVLLAAYVLAIPAADLFERRQWRLVSGAGLAMVVVAVAMVLTCVWADGVEDFMFVKLTAIAAIVTFALAHTAVLLRIPASLTFDWLFATTLGALWGLALLAAVLILNEVDDEFWLRVLAALGVMVASGTLALLIVAKLRRVQRTELLTTASVQVELRCPRCQAPQTIAVGATSCSACGLKFRLEVEEPRCAKCDYLLWNLPGRRCPECGTEF